MRYLAALLLVACSEASTPAAEPDTAVEPAADADTAADAVADAAADAAADADADADAAADADADADADAAASPCPADMVGVDTFCIDRYEAPNVAGAKPLAFQIAPEGEAWCKARGKRLCSEAEWVRACQGAAKLAYPYGATYKRSTCNDDKVWKSPSWSTLGTYPSDAAKAEAARLYQADPSGARTGCASEDGVMDLTGNVAEWVTRSFPNANNYDHVMKGCYWSGCYGGAPPSCGFVNPAHPGGFRTYEAGFRCCSKKS